jgi:hypothetical protein
MKLFTASVLTASLVTNIASASEIKQFDLNANKGVDAYTMIKQANFDLDIPDVCSHQQKKTKHLSLSKDTVLKQQTFVLVSHIDDTSCIDGSKRPRTEIKIPNLLKKDDFVEFSELVKLDSNFTGTDSFTHMFQVLRGKEPRLPIIRLSYYGKKTGELSDHLTLNYLTENGDIEDLAVYDFPKSMRNKWLKIHSTFEYSDNGHLMFTVSDFKSKTELLHFDEDLDMFNDDPSKTASIKFGLYRDYVNKNTVKNVKVSISNVHIKVTRK